ncbi:ATP-grasp domain-containing protein [Dolichospermum circinale]|uniref:ATP-grasp domain-containing protein n=1 Tax=Dolichospermum circinale TaxID=109265 RepID=UPI000402FA1C|nr:ATP-grasp domain-containing protein [Dolichospermum circinale]MDB9474942.1 ATP-grasp domain-containing protein [Dolichospermum circinale CS-537/11]MDB9480474.1 ATP-grasp domain-containing protein [Dolichospermum circinale CS-537/03]MDB9482204.1 ATP-grasp domain-containing protein [Dolichospermum circinale CS-537/05]
MLNKHNSQVYSFEPGVKHLKVLRENLQINDVKAEIYDVALSDETKEVLFHNRTMKFAGQLEAVLNVRNKANTRRVLNQLSSVNPKYAIIHDYESFSKSLKTVGIPCLLKPSGASFGRGIFKISAYEEAEKIFQQFIEYCTPSRDEIYSYFSNEFLLEEYLNGTEHSVAGIVADNQVYVLAITDKKINREIPFQYENIVPSKLSQDIQNQILEISHLAVQLMGINWCGFHIDLMVTDHGLRILEIGGRLGGECINSHLIPLDISEKESNYGITR